MIKKYSTVNINIQQVMFLNLSSKRLRVSHCALQKRLLTICYTTLCTVVSAKSKPRNASVYAVQQDTQSSPYNFVTAGRVE